MTAIFLIFINASCLAHDFYGDRIRIFHRSKNAINSSNFFESVFHKISDEKDKSLLNAICFAGIARIKMLHIEYRIICDVVGFSGDGRLASVGFVFTDLHSFGRFGGEDSYEVGSRVLCEYFKVGGMITSIFDFKLPGHFINRCIISEDIITIIWNQSYTMRISFYDFYIWYDQGCSKKLCNESANSTIKFQILRTSSFTVSFTI